MTGSASGPWPDYAAFDHEVAALGERMRRETGAEDLAHLRRVALGGRIAAVLGLATAWIAPNPVSVILIAQGMMARFTIGHHVGHGAYDTVPGVRPTETRRLFGRGWRRYLDWLDWWNIDDWLYTHNQLHHPNTQAPLDGDIMDADWLVAYPRWSRFLFLVFSTLTWKFSYYAPRMRREQATKAAGAARVERYDMRPSDLLDLSDPVVRTLWRRDYLPYLAARFGLPTLVAAPFGAAIATSVLVNLVLAELLHNAQTFVCIRPSHCARDIPLFKAPFADRREFYLQSILGTVNYRSTGPLGDFLQGWTNYQVEHHLWPTLTLRRYQIAHPDLVAACRRHGVPYREGHVLVRYALTARLFMGLDRQEEVDTRALIEASAT